MTEIDGDGKLKLACVAMGCIMIIVAVGMMTGHDGVLAASGLAAIGAIFGALTGYKIGFQKAAEVINE